LLLTTAVSASSAPGDHTQFRLVAGLALGSHSVRDDVLVPLASTGPTLTARTGFAVSRGPHLASLSFDGGLGVLFDTYDHRAWHVSHSFALAYLRWLTEKASPRWSVGASGRLTTDNSYFEDWDDAHGYWLATLMIGPAASYVRRVRADTWWETTADIGLVGIASRPPDRRLNKQDPLNYPLTYLFDRIGDDPEFSSVLDTQRLELESMVRFRSDAAPLGSGWGVGGVLRFAHTRRPEPYALWSFLLSGTYGWGW